MTAILIYHTLQLNNKHEKKIIKCTRHLVVSDKFKTWTAKTARANLWIKKQPVDDKKTWMNHCIVWWRFCPKVLPVLPTFANHWICKTFPILLLAKCKYWKVQNHKLRINQVGYETVLKCSTFSKLQFFGKMIFLEC